MILKRFNLFSVCLAAALLLGAAGCGRSSTEELMTRALSEADIGNWNEVLSLASTLADRDPGDPNAWVLKSIAAERAGQFSVALDSAKRGAELHRDSFAVQYLAGRLLASARSRRDIEAVTYLERAFVLRREDPRVLSLLIQCLARLNRPETENYYAVLTALNPTAAKAGEVASSVGVYRLKNGKLSDGIKLVSQAYDSDQNNPVMTLNLARALDFYSNGTMRGKSVPFYRRYLELTSLNPEASGIRTEVETRLRDLTRGNR